MFQGHQAIFDPILSDKKNYMCDEQTDRMCIEFKRTVSIMAADDTHKCDNSTFDNGNFVCDQKH